jgi:hypothetical protein
MAHQKAIHQGKNNEKMTLNKCQSDVDEELGPLGRVPKPSLGCAQSIFKKGVCFHAH